MSILTYLIYINIRVHQQYTHITLDLLAVFKKLRNNYKDSYKFWLGNELIVNTVDADDCNEVLSNRNGLEKADLLYGLMRKISKEGLNLTNGK